MKTGFRLPGIKAAHRSGIISDAILAKVNLELYELTKLGTDSLSLF